MQRKIIQIDQERCDGCGLCVTACHEGAIVIRDGKAQLVSDIYCDGLGDCLPSCPREAIAVIERDAEAFDAEAVEARLTEMSTAAAPSPNIRGCPALSFAGLQAGPGPKRDETDQLPAGPGQNQWPLKLHLLHERSPQLCDSHLLLAADCAAFVCPDLHSRFLDQRTIAAACPKLDDPAGSRQKLAAMFAGLNIASVTILRMDVPCCSALSRWVSQAMALAGAEVPVAEWIVQPRGDVRRGTGGSDSF